MSRLAFALLVVSLPACAVPAADPDLKKMEWKVGDDTREALVRVPAGGGSKEAAPVVFVWHGHGGRSALSARSNAIHKAWPEAVVVYAQGLKTPNVLVDPTGKMSGWQSRVGDQDDRDLKFFDAMLATLKKDHKIDEKRIYSTGHSNGGQFTYILWAARGDVFAAVAPSAAIPTLDFRNAKPKPVLHVAGEKDETVKFEWQKKTMDKIRKLNGCDADGKDLGNYATQYTSKSGPPVVTIVHSGGHGAPPEGTIDRIVEFFKANPKK